MLHPLGNFGAKIPMGISSIMSPERPVCNCLLLFFHLHPYTEHSSYIGMVPDGSSEGLGWRTPGSVTSCGTKSVFHVEQVPEAARPFCPVRRLRVTLTPSVPRCYRGC